jgi:diguanylate cyclase (GGDEF)-like protein
VSGAPQSGDVVSRRGEALAEVLVEFAQTLGTDFSIQRILDHLVLRIVDILPVTGAGVMLMGAHDELHFIAASNDPIIKIEALQNELHEGPCLEAYRSGQPVAVTDLSVDTRFPTFSALAAAAGLAAVFTFPMRLDAARLGALDLYRETPGPLNDHDLRAAQTLADVAAAYLFNAQARIDTSATVAQLNHRSLHDGLTGLPNRALLEELLDQAVARGRRSHHPAAVLFADLDGFKAVNDRHGHHIGDDLLCAVATRLSQVLRPGDTLARLGGDEFVILCEDLHHRVDAEIVAERIAAALATPFDLDGRVVTITASVGIAFSGAGQDIPDVLLRNADFAMYEAKQHGGGHHRVLDPTARLAADRRIDLEDDLRHAERRGQLSLSYQPIIATRTGALSAVEALLRWQHPHRGVIGPGIVIPGAERTGLITEVGAWVFRQACTDLQRWRATRSGIPAVAVNLSAHQVVSSSLADTVERILGDTGADASAVVLEVTETVFLEDAPRALAVLRSLKRLGVRLSLDDFGTGYSSLRYLHQFPFDIVKIDGGFTAAVGSDKVTRSIVTAMINLGHDLDLTVIAEGVETALQLADLTDLGADQAQGFYISRPLPSEEVSEWGLSAVVPMS